MGKTVPSYRIALEQEISGWNGFARALRKEDREAFEELMDMCRSFASDSIAVPSGSVFEPMVISIVLAQQEKMRQIDMELNANKPATSSHSAEKEALQNPAPVAVHFKKKKPGGEQTRLS
jgi:hypothetical protein